MSSATRATRYFEGMRQVLFFLGLLLSTSGAGGQTHLGIPPDDLVTLEMRSDVRGGCGEAKIEFVRTHTDGRSGGPFRVPEGKTLIVTEADWHYFSGQPASFVALTLFTESPESPELRQRVAESSARLGPDGVGGANARWTTGFPVAGGRRLCVGMVNAPLGTPLRLSSVILRGYLTD